MIFAGFEFAFVLVVYARKKVKDSKKLKAGLLFAGNFFCRSLQKYSAEKWNDMVIFLVALSYIGSKVLS